MLLLAFTSTCDYQASRSVSADALQPSCVPRTASPAKSPATCLSVYRRWLTGKRQALTPFPSLLYFVYPNLCTPRTSGLKSARFPSCALNLYDRPVGSLPVALWQCRLSCVRVTPPGVPAYKKLKRRKPKLIPERAGWPLRFASGESHLGNREERKKRKR